MARMICLESDAAEIFVNLDAICHATVTPDTVDVEFNGSASHRFTGISAHELIQALRHEEKRTARVG